MILVGDYEVEMEYNQKKFAVDGCDGDKIWLKVKWVIVKLTHARTKDSVTFKWNGKGGVEDSRTPKKRMKPEELEAELTRMTGTRDTFRTASNRLYLEY